jgi:hypothetical protein
MNPLRVELCNNALPFLALKSEGLSWAQGYRVCVWVVALKSFDMEFRHRTRRGTSFGHDMFSYFARGFPNAMALIMGWFICALFF